MEQHYHQEQVDILTHGGHFNPKVEENMKRNVIILCILILLLFPSIVGASSHGPIEIERLSVADADYPEITELDEEIKGIINSIREDTNLESLPNDYKIDYTKANKIYVDTDIFSLESSKKQDVKEALEEGTYMWLLTLDIENTPYRISISKGLPFDESLKETLTEEEIETIKAEEGKWIVTAIEELEGKSVDYESEIAYILEEINYESNPEVILCGGLRHIRQPVALVMNNEEVELLIPLYDLENRDTESQINHIEANTVQDVDGVYLYSSIKDRVNDMEDPDQDSVGSGTSIELSPENNRRETGYPIAIIIGIGLLGLAIAIVYGIRRKSN